MTKDEAKNKSIDLLKEVGIKDAEIRFNNYPHQFSGGMRQRVMIAMMMACEPKLLIADEPTTALDVTTQKEILKIFNDLKKYKDITIALISHDIGVISEVSDTILIMNEGKIIEKGNCQEVLISPKHEYTKELLVASIA